MNTVIFIIVLAVFCIPALLIILRIFFGDFPAEEYYTEKEKISDKTEFFTK